MKKENKFVNLDFECKIKKNQSSLIYYQFPIKIVKF